MMSRDEHLAWLRRRLNEVESIDPPTRLSTLQANSFRVLIRRIEAQGEPL